MDISSGLYKCKVCKKDYSSYKSLWNHNKKFHNTNVVLKGTYEVLPVVVCGTTNTNHNKCCKYCNKSFNDRSNKYKHEKICRNKNIIVNNTTQNINNNTQNNNNIQNNNQKYITINQFGMESLFDLNHHEILNILKSGSNMPIECIKSVNFNKRLPSNHSFCTTTLEGKHYTKINHNTQTTEKINKNEFIGQILDVSMKFIEGISRIIEHNKDIKDVITDEYINKLNDIIENKHKFYVGSTKKTFSNNINDMSYNLKDMILKTWEMVKPLEAQLTDEDLNGPSLLDEHYDYMKNHNDSE